MAAQYIPMAAHMHTHMSVSLSVPLPLHPISLEGRQSCEPYALLRLYQQLYTNHQEWLSERFFFNAQHNSAGIIAGLPAVASLEHKVCLTAGHTELRRSPSSHEELLLAVVRVRERSVVTVLRKV